MSQDLLRLIDSICRDKNIERDSFVEDLENAMASALRKTYETAEVVEVKLDRISGMITAHVDNHPIEMQLLGRIAAQTAKQVIIQKTRERERASLFEEFSERQGTIVTGTVTRIEGSALIVNIGRADGFLPRSEQIPGETHQIGDRIRALILEVREAPHQVKIILSRSHPEFIGRLFELEVPEIAERIIEIKALAREAGYRTKVAVASIDSKVDAVGACVGVRGSRIKNVVEELNNEKIDIVRWNESSQILIGNALKPAEVQETALCFELGKATVVVGEDQLSLAIGKRGQNVRLAARLTGWDIDIVTPAEYNKNLESLERAVRLVEGVDGLLIDKLVAIGCVSVDDIEAIGVDPLVRVLELSPEMADQIVFQAAEESIRIEEEREAAEKAKAAAALAGEPATAAAESTQPADGSTPADGSASADGNTPADPESSTAAAPEAVSTDEDLAATAAPETMASASESPTGSLELSAAINEPAKQESVGS